jgi:hypothetical protein
MFNIKLDIKNVRERIAGCFPASFLYNDMRISMPKTGNQNT